MLPPGRVTGMLLIASWTLTRGALMGKKWPLLPVSAMLTDIVVDGAEPGRFIGLSNSLVLETIESFRNYRVY
jgi:hypothetical protein